jgi:hypothetical protein
MSQAKLDVKNEEGLAGATLYMTEVESTLLDKEEKQCKIYAGTDVMFLKYGKKWRKNLCF